jgi:hypothetical protein
VQAAVQSGQTLAMEGRRVAEQTSSMLRDERRQLKTQPLPPLTGGTNAPQH